EDHLIQVAKADPWLQHHLPTFEWGGSSMIEDRGEIFPALEVDPTHDAVNILASAHQKVHERDAVIDVSSSVTDGGWFGDANIPAAIYGPGSFYHAHAVNEELSIKQLIQFTKTMIHFIYHWTSHKKS